MGEQKDSDRRSEGANDFFKPEPPEKQRETLHAILFEHFYKHKNFLHSAAWYYTDEQAKAFCKLMDKEWNDPSSNARKENNRLSSVLLHLPQDQPGLNIVDLGCGPGEKALLITGNFLHYNERGNTRIIHYFPVDISSNMLKSSIKAVRKAAALENAKCYVDENIDRIVETLSALGALEQEAGWSVTKDVKQGIQGKYTAFNTTINGIKGELRNMGLAGIENIIKELTHIETKCAESLKRLEHMSRNEIILLQARASFDALELPHPKSPPTKPQFLRDN